MVTRFLSKGSPERNLAFFILKLLLIWISWKLILWFLGTEDIPVSERLFPAISGPWEAFNMAYAKSLMQVCLVVLKAMGYEAYRHERIVWIVGGNGIGMGNYCLGIQLMYYFAMLILVSSISARKKVWGILIGISITNVLNIIRLVALNLVDIYAPDYMGLAHDHIFNAVVFGSLMIFYYFLTRKKTVSA